MSMSDDDSGEYKSTVSALSTLSVATATTTTTTTTANRVALREREYLPRGNCGSCGANVNIVTVKTHLCIPLWEVSTGEHPPNNVALQEGTLTARVAWVVWGRGRQCNDKDARVHSAITSGRVC